MQGGQLESPYDEKLGKSKAQKKIKASKDRRKVAKKEKDPIGNYWRK